MDQLYYSLCPHCSKTVYESIGISRVWRIERFFLSIALAPKVFHIHLLRCPTDIYFRSVQKSFSCLLLSVSWGMFQALLSLPFTVKQVKCWTQVHKYVLGQLNKILHLCRATDADHVGAAILSQMCIINCIYVSVKEIHIRVFYFAFVMGLNVLMKSTIIPLLKCFDASGLQKLDPSFKLICPELTV